MRLNPLALPPGKVKTCTGSHNCCYMHPRIARLVRSGGCTVCSAIKRITGVLARPKQLWTRSRHVRCTSNGQSRRCGFVTWLSVQIHTAISLSCLDCPCQPCASL
jgi:hypothetical protein